MRGEPCLLIDIARESRGPILAPETPGFAIVLTDRVTVLRIADQDYSRHSPKPPP